MTKTTAALGTLGLGATAAVTAPLAVKFGGGSSEGIVKGASSTPLSSNISNGNFPKISWTGTKIPSLTTSSGIKKEYKNIDCLKDYFKEGDDWTSEVSDTETPIFSIKTSGNNTNGCLVVEYNKQKYQQDNKWWGEFKLIWSLSNEQEGFITSFTAKTDSGSLKIDSSMYIAKKDQSKWVLKHRLEDVSETISSSEELSKKFPKPKNSSPFENTNNYWGFNPEIGKICKSNECTETETQETTENKSFRWNWKGGSGNAKISDWCENLEDWFKELSPSGSWNSIKDQLANVTGTWTKTT